MGAEGSHRPLAESGILLSRSPADGLSRQDQNQNQEAETRSRAWSSLASTAPVDVRYKAAYLLAGILDRSERYAEAAEVLGKAKGEVAVQANVKNFRKQHRSLVAAWRELAAMIRPEELRRWREEMDGETLGFQPVLLAGHPRSGTTLLEARLERHASVVALEETNAFTGGALAAAGFKRDEFLPRLCTPA